MCRTRELQTASSVRRGHESGVIKNGLTYAELLKEPYDVGDMTLAAEAHSLILRRTISRQPLLEVQPSL